MIELSHVHKHFQHQGNLFSALTDVTLHVKKGEIYGVMGPSGAGKSTLIRTVNLLERPSSGTVKIDGVELTALSNEALRPVRRNMGMIFQHFNLLSSRTVAENIAFPLECARMSKKEILHRVEGLCELTGLSYRKKAYPHELSGGQKQRVAIARALANAPHVLLSDEATCSLDPETTASILDLLQTINRELQLTILLITHEMEVIRRICHRACILEKGQIIEENSVLELFSQPKTDLAKRFVLSNFHMELPDSFQANMMPVPTDDAVPVVKMIFLGNKADQPLMVSLYKKFNVVPNVLQANLNWVQEAPMGMSICELLGQREAIVQGMLFLQSEGVEVEVLGYVNRSAASSL